MKVIAGRGAAAPHLTSILGRYCFFILATASSKYIAEIHYAMCRYSTCGEEEKAPCTLAHSLTRTKKRSMLMPPLEREGFLALTKSAAHIMYIFSGEKGAPAANSHTQKFSLIISQRYLPIEFINLLLLLRSELDSVVAARALARRVWRLKKQTPWAATKDKVLLAPAPMQK